MPEVAARRAAYARSRDNLPDWLRYAVDAYAAFERVRGHDDPCTIDAAVVLAWAYAANGMITAASGLLGECRKVLAARCGPRSQACMGLTLLLAKVTEKGRSALVQTRDGVVTAAGPLLNEAESPAVGTSREGTTWIRT
jgi:hypothetical protein